MRPDGRGAASAEREAEAIATVSRPLQERCAHRPGRLASPEIDLRARRDLVTRRIWREGWRRCLRLTALTAGDALAAATAAAFVLHLGGDGGTPGHWTAMAPIAVTLTVMAQAAMGTYGAGRARRRYGRVAVGAAAAAGLWMALGLSYAEIRIPALQVAAFGLLVGAMGCGLRSLAEGAVRASSRLGFSQDRTLIIVEAKVLAAIGGAAVARRGSLFHVTSLLSRNGGFAASLEELGALIEREDIRDVVVSAELSRKELEQVVRLSFEHGCAVGVVPAALTDLSCRVSTSRYLGWPLVELRIPRLHLVQVVLKRSMDLCLGLLALIASLPVMAVIAVAVKVSSRGSVLFRQERLGLGGRRFILYKFRTMRPDAEELLDADPELYRRYLENDYKLPADGDPRVTRVGRFLRRTSLDELPQLLNVLKAEMSLVGPRPVVPDEIREYGEAAPTFLAIKPGLTGHWQTNGRNDIRYPERVSLDMEYIADWSVASDLRILGRTLGAVLRGEGAH